MKKIGEELSKTRKEKGLSLRDIYQRTKIHPDIIRSIEDGTIAEKMHPIYAKGFLKSYSQCLGLAGEDIADRYGIKSPPKSQLKEKRETPEAKPRAGAARPKANFKLNIDPEKILLYTKGAGLFLASILIVSVIVYAAAHTFSFIKGAFAGRPEEKRVTIKAPAVKPDAKTEAKGASSSGALKKTTIEAKKKLPPAQVPSGAGAEAELSAPMPADTREQPAKPVSLLIRTTDDVWMKVKADDEVIFHDILPKNSSELWKAGAKIDLWVGKAEAIFLKLNGQDMGSPGYGVIKNIEVRSSGVYVNGKLAKAGS